MERISGGKCNPIYIFVPQDPVGLIRKVGKDLFNQRLDSILWKLANLFLVEEK